MAKSTAPQVVRSYLTQLERALVGLPVEVRDEIMAGIREELDGLDAAAAADRIETLGDPEFVAAEARAEAGASAAEPPSEPRWFPVLAALLVAVGGIVIPFIGWIVGIAMVWMSKSWRLRDKWIATLTPFAAVAVIPLATLLIEWTTGGSGSAGQQEPNPLIPAAYDLAWSGVVFALLVNVIVGVWLLVRSRSCWRSADAPTRQLSGVQPTWYSVLTVALIIVGGYVVPVVGWLVGVAMLWASDRWSRRDKWLGTLAGPAVIVAAVAVVLIVRLGAGDTGNLLWWHLVLVGGGALPLIANLIVGIRLLRR